MSDNDGLVKGNIKNIVKIGIREGIKKSAIVLILLIVCVLSACQPPEIAYANTVQIYYLNNEETALVTRSYQTNSTETDELVEEVLNELSRIPDRLEYLSPLAKGFTLLDYQITEGEVILDFNNQYNQQTVTSEVLVRAALVRTLTQIKGIDYVTVLVRSEPFVDSMGNIIGAMSADMFIDNVGNEINTLEKTTLQLYFANESGDGLIEITRSGVVYDSNKSIAQVVVEHLIGGPLADEAGQATINPKTQVVNITVQDGICYVSLDGNFSNQLEHIDADLTIYSITNSLVELIDINKVQILVNGTKGVFFRENINLTTVFERNLDIVTTG